MRILRSASFSLKLSTTAALKKITLVLSAIALLFGSVMAYQNLFRQPSVIKAAPGDLMIADISPSSGSTVGGTQVVLSGTDFMKQAVWKQVAPGSYHTCALAEDDWVYCWGANWGGQLGNGTEDDSLLPVAISRGDIPSNATIIKVSSGEEFSCAIASDNKAYCWGWGDSGQIGNGDIVNVSVPKAVAQGDMPTGAIVKDISTGMVAACAIANDKAYCWGW